MQKHKFASISLTVQDRAISSKFSTHRVSQQSTVANFFQVLEQNSCFPLGGHYACQCVLFLVNACYHLSIGLQLRNCALLNTIFSSHILFQKRAMMKQEHKRFSSSEVPDRLMNQIFDFLESCSDSTSISTLTEVCTLLFLY